MFQHIRVGVHFLSLLPEALYRHAFDALYIRLTNNTGITGYQLLPVRWLSHKWAQNIAAGLVLSIDPAWHTGSFLDALLRKKDHNGCRFSIPLWLLFGSSANVSEVHNNLLVKYPNALTIAHQNPNSGDLLELNPEVSWDVFVQYVRDYKTRFVWDTKHAQRKCRANDFGMFKYGWSEVLRHLSASRLPMVHLNLTWSEINQFLKKEGTSYEMLSQIFRMVYCQDQVPHVIIEVSPITLLLRGRERTLRSLVRSIKSCLLANARY